MNLSKAEKLILIMLSDLHTKLKVEGDIDPDFVRSAIFTDNLWGLEWKYTGIFEGGETPAHVRELCDILGMWDCLELSWERLSPSDRADVAADAAPFGGDVRFPGFDGNHEGEYLNAMAFLVDELDRFSRFKGRESLNSHMPSLETHRRMETAFKAIRPSLDSGTMSATQIAKVMKARAYPGT